MPIVVSTSGMAGAARNLVGCMVNGWAWFPGLVSWED